MRRSKMLFCLNTEFNVNFLKVNNMRVKLFLFFHFFAISIMANEVRTHLVVWAKDSIRVAYALSEMPKVTFSETDLLITTEKVEVKYALDKMTHFTYEYTPPVGVTNLQTDELLFKIDGESLLFPDLKANSSIFIYTVNGALVFKKIVQEEGEYSFPLSYLNSGVYLISVNGLTYKIVKK